MNNRFHVYRGTSESILAECARITKAQEYLTEFKELTGRWPLSAVTVLDQADGAPLYEELVPRSAGSETLDEVVEFVNKKRAE